MTCDTQRRLGLVAGFLAGEALGAPFGGVKGGHIRQLAGGWVDGFLAQPILFPDRPDKNHLPGLHSIAGQEFLAVLASGGDDASGRQVAARAAAHLRDLAGEGDEHTAALGALRASGRPLRRAIARWREDYPWDAADHFARAETSEGAAPCARALAGALLAGDEALALARLTHVKEAPFVAAWVVSQAARLLAACDTPKKIDAEGILDQLIDGARAIESEMRDGDLGALWKENEWGLPRVRFSECLSPVASLLRTGDDALAEKSLVRQAAEFAPAQAIAHVQHGFAPVLVPWVLYRALGATALVPAVEDAVNRGGEAPLVAALIGGLMGARFGLESIPPEWREGCLAWRVAESLALDPSPAAEETWLAAERDWTAREEAMRAPLRAEAEKRRAAAAPKKKPAPKQEPQFTDQGDLPFAPPPHVWLAEKGEDLAPWEKKRLKAERGRKRIDWKEDRRAKGKDPKDSDA